MADASRLARILSRRDETPEIAAFDLVAADGAPLPAFEAGAHIDVEAKPGPPRQYSLLALPDSSSRYSIGVLRDPQSRGGSLAMHRLKVGDEVRISPPRNHFGLARGARKTLLLAGGIGITPLLAMAQQLNADGAAFEFHYCARSIAHAAFLDRLSAYPNQVALHFDDGPASNRLDVDRLLSRDEDAHIYVCGPSGFMNWILDAAERLGRDPSKLHREFFAADPAKALSSPGRFAVRLSSSGRVIEVGADQSILQALIDHGLRIPMSCEAGVCGTCLTRVLQGEPDHRDVYLSKAEKARGDQILLCCSRSKSRELVLDL